MAWNVTLRATDADCARTGGTGDRSSRRQRRTPPSAWAAVVRSLAAFGAFVVMLVSSGEARAELEVLDGQVQRTAGETRAGAEGATLRLEMGSEVHLTAGTAIVPRVSRVWLPTLGLTQAHVLELRRGSVQVKVTDGHPVILRTARRLSIATSTGMVAVGLDAAVALEGHSWVQKLGSWRILEVGRRVMIDAVGSFTTAKDVLPAPSLQVERRLFAAPGARANLGRCSWSQVAGARAYTLTLHHAEVDREILRRSYSGQVAPAGLFTLVPGHYNVSVRAVDEHGLPGAASNVSIRVVGVATPDAITDREGVVMLPRGLPLALTHTSGLEMRLDNDPTWFPAVPSLMLRNDSRLHVHLKHPGSNDVVTIAALPRSLHARVRIGPKTALWPRDEVAVEVELVDGGDGSWAKQVPVVAVAHLGLSPLSLDWKRTGNVLRATVPTATDAGPWVVRVAVFDEDGKEIGRDVLEVVHQAAPTAMLGKSPR